jgi:hypothetical protein
MEYTFKLPKENYYKATLLVLNIVSNLGMTKLEVDILSTLLERNITVINTDSREIIRKVLDKDKFSLNNYIKRLKAKHILLPNKDTNKVYMEFYINPHIVAAVKDRELNFKFSLI